MAPATVYLHIGSPKTGTTYLQNTLWDNREALLADGVLLPGRTRSLSLNAIQDLLKWRPADGDPPTSWQRLTHEVRAWDGGSVVLSEEHLHKTTAAQFALITESFAGSQLEIVLTARDLVRSVPAQWQSSVRQRKTWTLGEYADAVCSVVKGEKLTGAAQHFWRRQDSPTIVRRFVQRLSVEQVTLVTVPPSGGDPDELWSRFCRACDLDFSATKPGEVSHESLGAASAEIMRLLNSSALVEELGVADYKKTINHALSRHSLSPRRGEERGLAFPERHRAWAEEQAGRIVRNLEQTGIEVIGDLEDLRPRPSSRPYVDPDKLPADELLDAALGGLAGMAMAHVELRAQFDAATAALAQARAEARDSQLRAGPTRPGGLERVLRRRQRGS